MKEISNKLNKNKLSPDPNNKKEVNEFAKGMINWSKKVEIKLEKLPWLYGRPKKHYKSSNYIINN